MEEYKMIDEDVKINMSDYPKDLQNVINQLEEYAKQGEWVMFDGYGDTLEVGAKHLYAIKRITKEQYYALLRRYRSF